MWFGTTKCLCGIGEAFRPERERVRAPLSRPRRRAVKHRAPEGFFQVSKWRPPGETFPALRAQLEKCGVKTWLVRGQYLDLEVVALFRDGDEAVTPKTILRRVADEQNEPE